jgi:hypothetical protein
MKSLKFIVQCSPFFLLLLFNLNVLSQVSSYSQLEDLAKKSSDDEIIDNSISYLNNLKQQIDEKEKEYQKQIQKSGFSLKWIKIEKLQKIQRDILLNFINPIAKKGNVKAILFLSSKNQFSSSISLFSTQDEFRLNTEKALDYLNVNKVIEPEILFLKFQFNYLKSGYFNETCLKNLNAFIELLNDYELARIRNDLSEKIDAIKTSNKELKFVISMGSISFNCDVKNIYISNGLICNPKGTTDFFLKELRKIIDLILLDKNPESLVQVLKDVFPYRKFNAVQNPDSWIKQLSDESEKLNREFRIKYRNPKNQYFSKNKEYGSLIFKLLASLSYCDDVNSLEEKSYFLNRAAEFGDNEALLNLASLFQTYYHNTKNSKYNDSCIFYLEKAIKLNLPEAFALKGIKVFNGEGYIKNKDEGVKLLLKAKSLNSETALILLETFPKNHLDRLKEGYYFNESVKLTYPWDFKVKCSNNCGKYTYPKEIIYGRYYDEKGSENMPQIKYSDFFFDNTGNPKINISYNDFRKTFTIAYLGFEYWKHVMCSATCQLAHENKNNSNYNAIRNKRNQIDNEIIKCVSCSKSMKRQDMVTIPDCPCYNESGGSIGISFTQSYDLHGDSEPKACSSQCQINFCKTKCASKGYTSKY